MHQATIAAAEEIQLLLPENQPQSARGEGILMLGAALVLLALPFWMLGSALRPRG
jgi:hypothetical protein